MLAAEQGLTELVEELISRGGNVNAKTIKDNNNSNAFPGDVTALQLAAQNGHLEMVKLLIENGLFLYFLPFHLPLHTIPLLPFSRSLAFSHF